MCNSQNNDWALSRALSRALSLMHTNTQMQLTANHMHVLNKILFM